jgi:hypothetical protein
MVQFHDEFSDLIIEHYFKALTDLCGYPPFVGEVPVMPRLPLSSVWDIENGLLLHLGPKKEVV